jgi:hypothetical protein
MFGKGVQGNPPPGSKGCPLELTPSLIFGGRTLVRPYKTILATALLKSGLFIAIAHVGCYNALTFVNK